MNTSAILSADSVAGNEPFGPARPKFKPGTPVWFVANWDWKGTVRIRPCFIKSCGKKHIHLLEAATGSPIEQRIYAEHVNAHAYSDRLYPRTETFLGQGEVLGLAVARQMLEYEREHLNNGIANYHGESGYIQAVRKKIQALHEPRVFMDL